MGKTDEPSMEEILSSIKRIIAEDGDVAAPRRTLSGPADDRDVLELTQPLVDADMPEPAPAEPEATPLMIGAEEAPALAEAPVAPPAEPKAGPLLSSATADATRAALASLSRMVVKPEEPAAADNTLEGVVRDLLRPMMKEWLDANLPRIVQETVDREVKRIAAGHGN
jgi:hypothetical protein